MAPSNNEVEVSIFGPGIGECLVIHLGYDEWIIIDSCIDRKTRQPVALQYLTDLGIDVAKAVKLFVVTHWHDDHINGASEVLNACPAAQFVCSAALRSDEFLKLIFTYSERSLMLSPGTNEFFKIFEELRHRAGAARPQSVGPVWAKADTRLLYSPKGTRLFSAEVYALSPSDTAMTLAFNEIGQQLPKLGTPKRRAVAQSPNHVSVAMWVMLDHLHILLGSDLEQHSDNRVGWKAVVSSRTRPWGLALVVKVPHHGSSNAYNWAMWTQMVAPDPIAILTPYASGKKPLPTNADIVNISIHTSQIYCTGSPTGWRPPRRDSTVEKTIREVVSAHRVVHGEMGQVRVRFTQENGFDNAKIELFGGARSLAHGDRDACE
jgi:hypothetical protein